MNNTIKEPFMKILFLDESYKFQSSGKNYFIMGGLTIDFCNVIKLNNELQKYKNDIRIKHYKELRGNHYNANQKMEHSNALVKMLKKMSVNFKTIILGPFTMKDREIIEAYVNALDFIVERFYLELDRLNEHGIIICHRLPLKLQDKVIQQIHDKNILYAPVILHNVNKGNRSDRILTSLSFSSDDDLNLLQITDLILTAVQGAVGDFVQKNSDPRLDFLKKNEDKLIEYNEYLRIYWEIIDQPLGTVSGWGIKVWQ